MRSKTFWSLPLHVFAFCLLCCSLCVSLGKRKKKAHHKKHEKNTCKDHRTYQKTHKHHKQIRTKTGGVCDLVRFLVHVFGACCSLLRCVCGALWGHFLVIISECVFLHCFCFFFDERILNKEATDNCRRQAQEFFLMNPLEIFRVRL